MARRFPLRQKLAACRAGKKPLLPKIIVSWTDIPGLEPLRGYIESVSAKRPAGLTISFVSLNNKLQNMSTLQFNGTPTDYIEISDSTDFSVATTGSLTLSVWMRPYRPLLTKGLLIPIP
jgi:hypothetical protein